MRNKFKRKKISLTTADLAKKFAKNSLTLNENIQVAETVENFDFD